MKKFLSLPIDWAVLLIPLLLTATGIVTIYTITFAHDGASLALNQLIYASVGLVIMLTLMFSDYRFWRSIATPLFIGGLLLLVPLLPPFASKLPFVVTVFGAHRWIDLGFFQFQPAEIFKLIAAIFGAKYLADKVGLLNYRRTIFFIVLALLCCGMVVVQPDLGTASVLLVIFIGLFLSAKPRWRTVAIVTVIAALALPIGWANLKDYQKSRVYTFLNPSADPQGQGYNTLQSLIAVGSGGLTGRGFGQGSQTVLNFLPVAHADYIFAGFAEASGFIGSLILVVLYVILIERAIIIARDSTDTFGALLAIAIAAKLTFQTVVPIAMNIRLLPATGIPLPFMSYGGTALIVDMAAIGLLQSIYIRHKKFFFA